MGDASTSSRRRLARVPLGHRLLGPDREPFHQQYLDPLARYYGSGITTPTSTATARAPAGVVAEWRPTRLTGVHRRCGRPVSQNRPLLKARPRPFTRMALGPVRPRHDPTPSLHPGRRHRGHRGHHEHQHRLPGGRGRGLPGRGAPYAGNTLAFLAILPTDPTAAASSAGGSLTVFEEGLTPTKLAAIIGGLAGEGLTTVSLPKFDQRNSDLEPALSAMGMTTAFKQGDLPRDAHR